MPTQKQKRPKSKNEMGRKEKKYYMIFIDDYICFERSICMCYLVLLNHFQDPKKTLPHANYHIF